MGRPGGTRTGRPPKGSIAERLGGVLAPAAATAATALPSAEMVPHQTHGGKTSITSVIVTSGKADQVIWLKLCAWPNRRIAQSIGLSDDAVDRYVKSPHYLARYEELKASLLGRVLEEMQNRLLEAGLEALGVRLEIMRNAPSRWLRDKVAASLLELAMEVGKARGPAGGMADKLVAILERIRKRKAADGTEIIEKIRFEGDAGAEGAALAEQLASEAHDPARGSEGAGNEPRPGEGDGAQSVEQTADPAGSGGN